LLCEHVLQIPTFSERYWATLALKAGVLEKVGRLEEAEDIKTKIRKEDHNASKEKDTKWYQHPFNKFNI